MTVRLGVQELIPWVAQIATPALGIPLIRRRLVTIMADLAKIRVVYRGEAAPVRWWTHQS